MGVNQEHALGRLRKVFAKVETTYGTQVSVVTGDAMKFLTFGITPDQPMNPRIDSKQTRTLQEEIKTKKTVAWAGEAYLLPNGAAGTAPDVDAMLKALLGVSTNDPGVSQVYTPADGQKVLGGLTLFHDHAPAFAEAAIGAWVEQATIRIAGGEEPKIALEGGAADYIFTGNGTVDAASAAAVTITVQAGGRENFMIGSRIKIVDATTESTVESDGAGAGHTITAYNRTTGVATISPGLDNDVEAADKIIPFAPAETTAGAATSGVGGSLTIAAGSVDIVGAEIVIKNNVKPWAEQAFTEKVTDYLLGNREVSGSVNILARRDLIKHLGKTWDFGTQALVVTCGDTAGAKVEVTCALARFQPVKVEVPESEEAVISLPFIAKGTTADEISISFE